MPNEDPSQISDSRKTLYYTGMAMTGLGLLVFISMFFTMLTSDPFHPGRFGGIPVRIVVSFLLMIIGGAVTRIGARGLAGSGLILDPTRARQDIEPWSRMAGGVVNDALEEVGAAKSPVIEQAPAVRIRCRACQALNDEDSKFCNQCGSKL